jgi:hypothetical protein
MNLSFRTAGLELPPERTIFKINFFQSLSSIGNPHIISFIETECSTATMPAKGGSIYTTYNTQYKQLES